MMKREVNEVSRARLAMRCLSALACLLLFALAAYGQGNNGSITGTITDSSGAVAPNASIDVKNTDTGAVFHGGTSNTGNYVVPVPAGKYELTVTAAGLQEICSLEHRKSRRATDYSPRRHAGGWRGRPTRSR